MTTTTKRAKLNPADFRPVVKIFGEDYKLPYYTSKLADAVKQETIEYDIRRVIDASYPGIKRPECHMLYLHMINSTRKHQGKPVLPTSREITLSGQKFQVAFDDIIPVVKLEHEVDGIKYVFKQPSMVEILDMAPGFDAMLRASIDYIEKDGIEYDMHEDASFPYELALHVEEIQGTVQLVLKSGETVTGLERIQELFLHGQFL